MEDLDMSRPGSELFPETGPQTYNSYQDVNQGQVVDDPLDMQAGVNEANVAGSVQMSDKEMNFRALREETAKLKQESEYWRGQAEAYSRAQHKAPEPVQSTQQDAFSALDLEDSKDVRKAFEVMREENHNLRSELRDAMKAMTVKAQRQDWDNMVTQHVPQLTSKNPIFAEMIQNSSNPYEAAYLLAELNAKSVNMQQQQQTGAANLPQQNGNAQRAIANASKPQSIASVGGRSTLSNADYYASMSDDDFMKLAAKNMASI